MPLYENLPQLFRYLRHLAIEQHQQFLMGVLTNYKEWYFVRYNLLKELESAFERKPLSHECFEVSDRFDLIDDA